MIGNATVHWDAHCTCGYVGRTAIFSNRRVFCVLALVQFPLDLYLKQ